MEDKNKVMEPTKDEVKVSKKELSALLKRVDELEKGSKGEKKLERPDHHIARIRMYKDKPIIDIKGSQIYKDSNKKELLKVTFTILDGDKEKEVELDYKEFSELDCLEAKIIRVINEDKSEVQGYSEAVKVDGYKTIGLGIKVPNEVKWTVASYEIEMPDGDVIICRKINV